MNRYKHKLSIWETESLLLSTYDVVIIGAGITGLSTAIQIASDRPDLKLLVVEKLPIGAGASSRNAGFACIGSISELESDLEVYGEQNSLQTVKRRLEGLQLLRSTIGDDQMNYKRQTGLELFEDKRAFEKCQSRLKAWNEALMPITGLLETFKVKKIAPHLNFYDSGIENNCEGLINTGLMYKALYRRAVQSGVQILNNIALESYEDCHDKVLISLSDIDQVIGAKQLILCTNAFTKDIVPDIELTPCRNQVIVTSPLQAVPINNGCHFNGGYIYFRPIENRVLIGGARDLFAEEDGCNSFGSNVDNIEYLKQFLKQRVILNEDFTIDYDWSGILTGGTIRTPIVKAISPNVLAGVRLGGMGVAIGSSIGKELATLCMERTL